MHTLFVGTDFSLILDLGCDGSRGNFLRGGGGVAGNLNRLEGGDGDG